MRPPRLLDVDWCIATADPGKARLFLDRDFL